MTILVTGANGQVGHELTRLQRWAGHSLHCLGRDELDITEGDRVDAIISAIKPAMVINAAAFTAVDKAETDKDKAFAVNRSGPLHLATTCRALGIPLLHLSTDYVFDGRKNSPYSEEDPVNPLGIYGSSKLAGEEAVREVLAQHIIVRTSWVFGAHGNNFVKIMLRIGREREQLNIVDDQFGGPTPASDIARVLLRIAETLLEGGSSLWGTYHFSGVPPTTWFHFAEEVFNQAATAGFKRPKLEPIPTTAYPTPAERPANSVFDCSKIREKFGIEQPDWRQGLARVLEEIAAVGADS